MTDRVFKLKSDFRLHTVVPASAAPKAICLSSNPLAFSRV